MVRRSQAATRWFDAGELAPQDRMLQRARSRGAWVVVVNGRLIADGARGVVVVVVGGGGRLLVSEGGAALVAGMGVRLHCCGLKVGTGGRGGGGGGGGFGGCVV
jgi:hypothetical protein